MAFSDEALVLDRGAADQGGAHLGAKGRKAWLAAAAPFVSVIRRTGVRWSRWRTEGTGDEVPRRLTSGWGYLVQVSANTQTPDAIPDALALDVRSEVGSRRPWFRCSPGLPWRRAWSAARRPGHRRSGWWCRHRLSRSGRRPSLSPPAGVLLAGSIQAETLSQF